MTTKSAQFYQGLWITEACCVPQDEELSLLAIICWFLLYELHGAAPISLPSLVQRIQDFLAGINIAGNSSCIYIN